MQRIKLATDFSGVGASVQALKRLNIPFEEQFACDLDKFARHTYLHNYGTKEDLELLNHPDVKRIDSIYYRQYNSKTKVSQEDLDFVAQNEEKCARMFSFYYPWNVYSVLPPEESSDLYITTPPCFVGDTLVNTVEGFKKIEDVKVGDLALTHNNRFMPVTDFGSKLSETYKLNAQGIVETETTGNHRYFVRERFRKWNNEKKCDERCFTEPKWVEVKDLTKNHFIGINIPNKNENPFKITKDEAYVLGRYLADGWIRDRTYAPGKTKGNSVILAIGKNKIGDISSKIKFNHKLENLINGVSKLFIHSNSLVKLIYDLKLGQGAGNKRIPNAIINLPIEILKEFLIGYMDGDGHSDKNYFRATSISKELLMGIQLCVSKIYGVNANIKYVKTPPTTIIQGRTVNKNDYYILEFRLEMKKQSVAAVIGGVIWYPIRSIEKSNEEKIVYDITVDDDHSYTANQAIVHNCQAFSLAGNRKGEDDDRGVLFYNSHKYIKENKPRYFILENVKGLLSDDKTSGSKGKFGRTFNRWLDLLGGKSINGETSMWPNEEAVPYHIYWKVVNAKDRGVPQNRERVFIVGIRDDLDNSFTWPKDEPLKLRLKDVLETFETSNFKTKEDFDGFMQKYFLSDKAIEGIISSEFNSKSNIIQDSKGYSDTLLSMDYKDPKCVKIKSATSKGYETATENDSIDLKSINNPNRGNIIFKDSARTLDHNCNQGVIQLNNPKHSNDRIYSEEGCSPTLNTMQGGNRQPFVSVVKLKRTDEAKLKRSKSLKETGKDTGSMSDRQYEMVNQENSDTILANPNPLKDGLVCIQIITPDRPNKHQNGRRFKEDGDPSFTLTAQDKHGIFDGFRIRRLTPREVARLMDFHESFTWPVSDSQVYKQMGNSVVVQCFVDIVEQLNFE